MDLTIQSFFVLIAVFLPSVLAVGMIPEKLRRPLSALAPLTALPALALAFTGESGMQVTVPWLFFEAQFGLGPTSQGFLAFTALVWLAAAVFASGMSGNFGLIIAQDVFSFYFLFALMSFPSFALVVHSGSPDARRAGVVYIWLVVIGEALVFSALLLGTHAAGTSDLTLMGSGIAAAPRRNLILAMAFLGFGVKAGALPLHVWLPLAHPVAPTPASAVLSGCMIKAGLLGWLRLFPLGVIALPSWGMLLIVSGLGAAFGGVLVGLTRNKPKAVLAYSSISQMGVMTTALGLGLLAPEKGEMIWRAILVYAAHHAAAKGALFLSVGTAAMPVHGKPRRWAHYIGLVLPAAAIMGVSMTGGALAKGLLKYQASAIGKMEPAAAPVKLLISLAAVGTVLIMVRFLWLIWPRPGRDSAASVSLPARLSWIALVVAVASFCGWISLLPGLPDSIGAGAPGLSLSSQWPILLGLALGAWAIKTKFRSPFSVPEGDLLVVYAGVLKFLRKGALAFTQQLAQAQRLLFSKTSSMFFSGINKARVIEQVDLRLTAWPVFGTMFMLLLVLFFIVMTL
jgi:formate hydrogenlyase subunit 3/multisubunit Na+/H+ antiporter MnhD subunit